MHVVTMEKGLLEYLTSRGVFSPVNSWGGVVLVRKHGENGSIFCT